MYFAFLHQKNLAEDVSKSEMTCEYYGCQLHSQGLEVWWALGLQNLICTHNVQLKYAPHPTDLPKLNECLQVPRLTVARVRCLQADAHLCPPMMPLTAARPRPHEEDGGNLL